MPYKRTIDSLQYYFRQVSCLRRRSWRLRKAPASAVKNSSRFTSTKPAPCEFRFVVDIVTSSGFFNFYEFCLCPCEKLSPTRVHVAGFPWIYSYLGVRYLRQPAMFMPGESRHGGPPLWSQGGLPVPPSFPI